MNKATEINILNNPIITYTNEQFKNVRSLFIDGEPWFVGKDIADNLGYSNTRKAIADHVDDEDKIDGVTIRDSLGRDQTPILINESGLYALIFGSKLDSAKRFKHWVTSEVLPSIRKTGSYTYSSPTSHEEIAQYASPLPLESPKEWFYKMSSAYSFIEDYYNITRKQLFCSIFTKLKREHNVDINNEIEKYKEKYSLDDCYSMEAIQDNPEYRDLIETMVYEAVLDLNQAIHLCTIKNVLDRQGYRS